MSRDPAGRIRTYVLQEQVGTAGGCARADL